MTSFRKLIDNKTLKRADAMKARIEDIHIEPGFNLRGALDVTSLKAHIAAGGIVPPLEVRPRAEGGVWIVDGHRRLTAYRELDAEGALPRTPSKEGAPELWLNIVPFEGNDADRVARVLTSSEGEKLQPLEVAQGYQRLRAFGWTTAQIAAKVSKTAQHVSDMLTLGDSNHDVRQPVLDGHVSASTATALVRRHGEGAGAVIAKAVASGVRPKVVKPSADGFVEWLKANVEIDKEDIDAFLVQYKKSLTAP